MKIKKGKTVFTIIGAIFFIIGDTGCYRRYIIVKNISVYEFRSKTKAEIINISADSYRRNGKIIPIMMFGLNIQLTARS